MGLLGDGRRPLLDDPSIEDLDDGQPLLGDGRQPSTVTDDDLNGDRQL